MKKKTLKVKWLNVLLALIFIFASYIVLHDTYMLTIHSWITSEVIGWTWLGFITFALAFATVGMIINHFAKEVK